MKAVTANEMREVERIAIDEYGISEKLLMGFAGREVANVVLSRFSDISSVAIICGTGNNGGDGFTAAYFLHNAGLSACVYLFGDEKKFSDSSLTYFELCKKSGIEIIVIDQNKLTNVDFHSFDLIIDALFGTGLRGPVKETATELIKLINFYNLPVVSIDIPSGLSADGEAPRGHVVYASCTVTMGLPKISLVTWPGIDYCGDVVIADIGLPSHAISSLSLKTELIDIKQIAPCLQEPGLASDINKSDRGHLLFIGGFDGMEGSVMMSIMAALETGTGYVSLLTTETARRVIAGIIPELMTMSLEEKKVSDVLASRKYDAIVIGPGMGRSEIASRIFDETIKASLEYANCKVLIDGDGLFHLAAYLKMQKSPVLSASKYVLTPHFMEAERLMGRSVASIKENRLAAARECAALTNSTVLLKGPASIISSGEFSYINTKGNSLLACAGSGDVLSGIIGAYLLRDVPVFLAACAGCYFHGAAADFLFSQGKTHIKATDIITALKINQTKLAP